MTAQHPFIARLNLRHPIIQAPMAGVSTPRLAAAVTNAGALGSLGVGASTVSDARQAIIDTRALTAGPINVNVFCHAPARRDPALEHQWVAQLAPLFAEFGAQPPTALQEIYPSFIGNDAAFEMLLEQRPAAVSFHFGLPSREHISAFKQAGICTLANATNLHEAQLIEESGVDAIIAQGVEAGGHRGMFDPAARDDLLTTAVLVRLLVQRTQLPIIAAGGIMDGWGIKAALTLGATAVQLGTAFILCPESSASDAYRQALQSPDSWTALTRAISGRPARGIHNRLIAIGESPGAPSPADYPVAYDAAKQLHQAAARHGNHAFAAHWAGQGVAMARALPAEELIRSLVEELAI